MQNEELMGPDGTDDLENFEAHETSHKLPIAWLALFLGLLAFGIYYYIAYTPAISGWTQVKAYEQSLEK